MKKAVMTELKQTFRPEFLNRVDETIVFRQLTESDVQRIAKRLLDKVAKRMDGLGVTLRYSPEALVFLARQGYDKAKEKWVEEGYDPAYGARPLRRVIRSQIEDPAAVQLLSGELSAGDIMTVEIVDGKVSLAVTHSDTSSVPG